MKIMTEEIEVNFQARNPSGIKLLNRLYDGHLVLNDIGVRLDEQLNNEDEELTVPTKEDIDNLSDTFGKTVEAFSDITIGIKFALLFTNNGIAYIVDSECGLEIYDNYKINNWVNQLMGDIVETNESFNTLVNE